MNQCISIHSSPHFYLTLSMKYTSDYAFQNKPRNSRRITFYPFTLLKPHLKSKVVALHLTQKQNNSRRPKSTHHNATFSH